MSSDLISRSALMQSLRNNVLVDVTPSLEKAIEEQPAVRRQAVLVMEMPESCSECPMEMDVEDTTGEKWIGNICRGCGRRNADRIQKPGWCPLIPMPEKKSYADLDEDADEGELTFAYWNGWNACLDTIEGSRG